MPMCVSDYAATHPWSSPSADKSTQLRLERQHSTHLICGQELQLLFRLVCVLYVFASPVHSQTTQEEPLPGPDSHETGQGPHGHLFGDWGGERSRLLDRGIKFDFQYVSDSLWNIKSEQKERFASWNRFRGTVDIDLYDEPLGEDKDGQPVFLKDLWPTQKEIRETLEKTVTPELFQKAYGNVFEGSAEWRKIQVGEGDLYPWDDASTYIHEPPYFAGLEKEPSAVKGISGARVLAILGDSITTDHISPAGDIEKSSPAGTYLQGLGVKPEDFNSYGSRRGNDRVMVRGTFANVRLRNQLAGGKEGPWTKHLPTGDVVTIHEASERYRKEKTALVVLAGKEYGSGSSRDWAAKGPMLLGVAAVIAESYERIHRSNLVGMGVLPLQFEEGQNRESLGLSGQETFEIQGLNDGLQARQQLTVVATSPDGKKTSFSTTARIYTPVEVEYFRNGGILQTVLRRLLKSK